MYFQVLAGASHIVGCVSYLWALLHHMSLASFHTFGTCAFIGFIGNCHSIPFDHVDELISLTVWGAHTFIILFLKGCAVIAPAWQSCKKENLNMKSRWTEMQPCNYATMYHADRKKWHFQLSAVNKFKSQHVCGNSNSVSKCLFLYIKPTIKYTTWNDTFLWQYFKNLFPKWQNKLSIMKWCCIFSWQKINLYFPPFIYCLFTHILWYIAQWLKTYLVQQAIF